MKGFENFEVPRQILDKLRGRERRANVYSVTKLVCCPRKTYYKMTGVKELITDETQLIFVRGRGHHGALEVLDAVEIEVRKKSNCGLMIYGDVDMRGERIIEVYTTTLSSKKIPEGDFETTAKVFPLKYKQLKAYCHMSNEGCGDLLAFFLFGDYSRFEEIAGRKVYVGIRPKLRDFTYEFTDKELEEIWSLMNTNLEEIEYSKKTGSPPLMSGEEFECKSCGFSYTCLGETVVAEPTEELK